MSKVNIQEPKIPPEDYNRILRGLNLAAISLLGCDAKCDPEIAKSAFSQSQPVPVETNDKATYQTNDKSIVVIHNYQLVSKWKRRNILAVKASYKLTFSIQEDITPEFFDVFQELALPIYTWPFFRELVHSMTGRMDVPRLELGLRHTPQF